MNATEVLFNRFQDEPPVMGWDFKDHFLFKGNKSQKEKSISQKRCLFSDSVRNEYTFYIKVDEFPEEKAEPAALTDYSWAPYIASGTELSIFMHRDPLCENMSS
jgi:hypothetical protein